MPSKKYRFAKPSKKASRKEDQWILRVLTGEADYGEVCDVLLLLSAEIRQGLPLTPASKRFLADALQKIAEGGDPKAAFNIRRKRGQRDTREAVRNSVNRAFFVAELLREKEGSKKMSVEKAIAQVALETGRPEDTVRADWRDYRHNVELSKKAPGWAFVNYTPKKRKKRLKAGHEKQPK